MSALRQPCDFISADNYLVRERLAETRSEYVNGHVYAMAGARVGHQRIAGNIYRRLGNQLQSRPCEAFASEMKVRIDKANAFHYPDVSGLCGPIIWHDKVQDAYCNPAVIFEVLSPSTEAYDRGEKFHRYRLLDSVLEFVLVRSDRVEVEVFTRFTTQEWKSVLYNELSDTITLRSLGGTLSLAEVFERVEFGE